MVADAVQGVAITSVVTGFRRSGCRHWLAGDKHDIAGMGGGDDSTPLERVPIIPSHAVCASGMGPGLSWGASSPEGDAAGSLLPGLSLHPTLLRETLSWVCCESVLSVV